MEVKHPATFPAPAVCVAPLREAFCHSSCWSGCENRFVGTVAPCWYAVLVVGATSVPTFVTRATALLSNSFAISGRFACNAKFGACANWLNELCGKVTGPLIDA